MAQKKVRVETYDQVSAKPTAKVSAAGIGGSVSVVILWFLSAVFNIDVPAEVGAAIATIVSFASGYLVREKRVI